MRRTMINKRELLIRYAISKYCYFININVYDNKKLNILVRLDTITSRSFSKI